MSFSPGLNFVLTFGVLTPALHSPISPAVLEHRRLFIRLGIVGFLRYFASGKFLLQLIASIFLQYFDKGTEVAFFVCRYVTTQRTDSQETII